MVGGVSRVFAIKSRADNPGERFAQALEKLGPAYIHSQNRLQRPLSRKFIRA